MRRLVAVSNPAAAGPVHAHGVDFVDVGQRVVLVGKIADRVDRGDIAVHRIDALKRDQLGHIRIGFCEQLFQMRDIVVAEHLLLGA